MPRNSRPLTGAPGAGPLQASPVEAFIFDIDGTIIDSMPYHNRSWPLMLARHGLGEAAVELVRSSPGRTGVELMREIFGADLPLERAPALVDEKETIYRELFRPDFREVAGFTAFARAARGAGLKLALGTAGDANNIAFALGGLGMHGFFDATVGAPDVERGKPEPDIFLEAARRMDVEPERCIVFEDAPLGIEAARRAGMRAVALTTSLSASDFQHPHVIHICADYSCMPPSILVDGV
jgi:beta-phosphoglucomutase-like phosphatase (HAD superfamily)